MNERRPPDGVLIAASSRLELGEGFAATTESSQRGQGGRVGVTTQRSRYRGPTLQERLVSGGGACFLVAGLGGVLMSLSSEQVRQKIKRESLKVFALDAPAPLPEVPTPPRSQPEVAIVQTPRFDPVPTQPVVVTTMVTPVQPVVTISAAPPNPAPAAPAVPPSTASTTPRLVQNPSCNIPRPAYPVRAKRLQQTGVVVVSMTITSDGRIVSQTVSKSSGHAALDSSALEAVSGGRCRSGVYPTTVAANLPVVFGLDR